MRSYVRPLRALLPFGVLSNSLLASRTRAEERKDQKSESDNGQQSKEQQMSLGSRLASALEEWLLPTKEAGSMGKMLEELRGAIAEDFKITPEESQRLPMNLLMLKSLNDREIIESNDDHADDLDEEDWDILDKAARFSKFASAAYGCFGNVPQVKAILAEEEGISKNVLTNNLDDLQRWFISKHTGIERDDVKGVDTTGSMEMRGYVVAVDHSTRSVVLSVRGTFSLSDTMIDLLCKPCLLRNCLPTDVVIDIGTSDFAGGKAHQGIARSAVSVWTAVGDQVQDLLRQHADYKLVLTGHSLGAGTAVLLKRLFDYKQKSGEDADESDADENDDQRRTTLDAGRPVHVECYAFATPPVFAGPDAESMPYVYSFVYGSDSVPTMSLGSLYSLYRTIQKIDQLPVDVYQRVAFILDCMVRVQQKHHGGQGDGGQEHRHKIAENILRLAEVATDDSSNNDSDGDGAQSASKSSSRTESEKQQITETTDESVSSGDEWTAGSVLEAAKTAGSRLIDLGNNNQDAESGSMWNLTQDVKEGTGVVDAKEAEDDGSALSDVWSAMSNLDGGIMRLTEGVRNAAESLVRVVDKAGATAGRLYDGVGEVTGSVAQMTSEEIALTAILVKELAAGGGPTSDEVMTMIRKCRDDGVNPNHNSVHPEARIGDLVVPGRVYRLRALDSEDQDNDEGWRACREKSVVENGISLSNRMVDDHSMERYEPAILSTVQSRSEKIERVD